MGYQWRSRVDAQATLPLALEPPVIRVKRAGVIPAETQILDMHVALVTVHLTRSSRS